MKIKIKDLEINIHRKDHLSYTIKKIRRYYYSLGVPECYDDVEERIEIFTYRVKGKPRSQYCALLFTVVDVGGKERVDHYIITKSEANKIVKDFGLIEE